MINEDKEKYDPESVVVPPFERLPDGSCPNVFTMLTSAKEEQNRQKIRELLKIPYGIIRKFENGTTLWYEPITDETDGFVLRVRESPIQTVFSEKRGAYIMDLEDDKIIAVFPKK